jgi:hypothetical protein
MRRYLLVSLTVLILLNGMPLQPAAAQGTPVHQPTAFEMFAAMNAWRLEQNLAPFRYNATLEALAWLQLEHVLALPDIPSNIHDGILGEGPRDRALWEPNAWPYYDIPARLDLVEIIVAQKTVQQGIDWWKHSDIHRRAATNPNYREMGVAALPYVDGTVFVAVLGGRPDVLPVTIHPDREHLYLTKESFWGATANRGYIVDASRVRLLDTDRNVLSVWQRWQPILPMPQVSGDRMYVEYSDGSHTVTTEVDLQRDVFLLPDYVDELRPFSTMSAQAMDPVPGEPQEPPVEITGAELALTTNGQDSLVISVKADGPLFLKDFQIFALLPDAPTAVVPFSEAFDGAQFATPNACFILAVEGTSLDVPEHCTGLVVVKHVAPQDAFWYLPDREMPAPMFVLNMSGGLLANCRDHNEKCTFPVEAAAAPAGVGGGEFVRISNEIRLVYNAASLTLINNGGQPLNLYGLTMRNGNAGFLANTWNRAGLTADLGYFPADDCLQVGTLLSGTPRKHPGCNVRHGWLNVRESQAFWTQGEFEVSYSGTPLATCEASKGTCIFELP